MIDRGTGTLEKTSGPGKNDPFQERYNQLDHNQTLSDNYQQFIDKLKLTPDQDYTNPLAPIRNHQFGQLSPVEERIADRRTMVGSAFSGDKMIARAQANLAIAGYELDGEGFKGVNGKEGPKTTQAVKDFQTAAGLKPTGIIDQETIKAMDLAAEKGMTKQEIEALGNQIAKQNEPPPVGDQPQEHQLTPELTPQEQQQLAKRDDLVKQAYSTTKGGNYQLAQAQASLELAGYKLEKHGIDGKMGDETRANLRQFQKDWGIPETSDFYETYYALREATVKEWKRPPEQKVEQEPGKQPVKELKSELTPKLEKEDMIPHYTGTYDKAAQFNRIGKILPQKNFVYDQVKDSQTKLKEMGFNIGPAGADGKIGKYTREAVIEFQKMNHLKITGELDKVTAAQIESVYQKGAVVEEYKTENIITLNDIKQQQKVESSSKNQYNTVDNITSTERFKRITPEVTNTIGQRSAEAYNQVIDQFDVENNPRYKASSDKTFCNIFAWDVTSAMGAEIPHWVNDKGKPSEPLTKGAHEMNANLTAKWLKEYGEDYGWQEASAKEAQEAANKGEVAVAVWYNNQSDDKNPWSHDWGSSGHIVIVRPLNPEMKLVKSSTGLYIAQAGTNNYSFNSIEKGFNIKKRGQTAEPHDYFKYYIHR